MTSPEFINSVVLGIKYWHQRTRDMDDQVLTEVDSDRQNLFRIVQFGIDLPSAWPMVANVAVQMMPMVSRRMYRGEWMPVLEQLLTQCPADDQHLKIELLIQLGRIQRLERHLEKATITHQAAEVLALELEDEGIQAQVFYSLGRGYYDRHHFEEAEQYCQAALEILSGMEDPDRVLVAWSLITIGSTYSAQSEFIKAGEYLARGVAIGRTLNDPTRLARALVDQSHNFMCSDRLYEAINCLLEAEALLAPTANELDKTVVGINLGSIYYRQGLWRQAEETFRQAYSIYLRQSGNLHYQAFLTSNLGNVLLKLERLSEAEAYMRQSVNLWRQMDDDLNLANAVGSLGEILVGQGKMAAAIPLFDEGLILLKKYPNHPIAKGLPELFERERKKAVEHLHE
jgi:tetratricopeptide (TPR) repeat protein